MSKEKKFITYQHRPSLKKIFSMSVIFFCLSSYVIVSASIQQPTTPSEYLEQLHNNWRYLLTSLIIFISIVLLALYGGIKKEIKRSKRKTIPFISITCGACIVLLFSLWDIVYQEQWLERIIALYGILIVLTLLFLVSTEKKKPVVVQTAEEFEKSLQGTLHHFRCPCCGGMFAIKKSKQDNKKSFTITCPDCGTTGLIPPVPLQIRGNIPQKKSVHKNFICERCKEWVMIWAEGTDIVADLHVFSCPYCGTKHEMRQT
jgi:predicted RNA-binding Zn-ribbon protein involved in translation (DUF1610 family)